MAGDAFLPGTGRGTVGEADGGGGWPRGNPHEEGPLHQPLAGPPPRAGEEFLRLAGFSGLMFGWTPDIFWGATPAELAALVRAAAGEDGAPLGSDEVARLKEAFPDG